MLMNMGGLLTASFLHILEAPISESSEERRSADEERYHWRKDAAASEHDRKRHGQVDRDDVRRHSQADRRSDDWYRQHYEKERLQRKYLESVREDLKTELQRLYIMPPDKRAQGRDPVEYRNQLGAEIEALNRGLENAAEVLQDASELSRHEVECQRRRQRSSRERH